MTTPNAVRDCLSCHRPTARLADPAAGILLAGNRGLCRGCYERHARAKTLGQFPTKRVESQPTRPCADCGNTRSIVARNLCSQCYDRHKDHGTLSHYPPMKITGAIVYEKWLGLPAGMSIKAAAEHIGCHKDTLRKALIRYGARKPPEKVTPHKEQRNSDAMRHRPLVMELLDEPIFPTDEAACATELPLHWDENGTDYGREVCGRCPVRADCLDWALKYATGGLWGGMDEKERRGIGRRGRVAS